MWQEEGGICEGAGQFWRAGRAAEGGAEVAEGRGRGRPGGQGEGRQGDRRLPPRVSGAAAPAVQSVELGARVGTRTDGCHGRAVSDAGATSPGGACPRSP